MDPPGAGIRRYSGEKAWAERGFITLQVGIAAFPYIARRSVQALGASIGGYSTRISNTAIAIISVV